MTTINLKNKLSARKIDYTEKSYNELNKAITFKVNGYNVEADYYNGQDFVHTYSIVTGYDNSNQEQNYIFFKSLNKVLNFTEKYPN